MDMKPDFDKAYQIANDVLLQSSTISSIPFDPALHLKEETDIKLMKYLTAKRKYGLAVPDLGSDEALIVEDSGRFIIFYNHLAYEPRKKWSITHEMGHFYLGHNLDFKNISEELRAKQEIEANFFAAQLLMPDAVIWRLVELYQIDINPSFLENRFGVSNEAASKRIETLYKQFDFKNSRKYKEDADAIVLKFGTFINSLKPEGYYSYSSFEDEEEMQKERDTWQYDRKRYR